jgi:hypothetical protein
MSNIENLQPIILIGAGRSGTKFLRDMLGVSSDVSIIPYDVGYIWRYGNETYPDDEFMPNMASDKIKKHIVRAISKLIKRDSCSGQATMFIEKSVPNALRPAFVSAIYPGAKFIHLIRDGRAVTESAMRLWQTSPEKKYLIKKIRYFPWGNYKYALWYIGNFTKGFFNLKYSQRIWGPRYHGIVNDATLLPLETICARQWKKCVELSVSQLSVHSKEEVLEVRYEDLIQDSKTIETICEFIGITDKKKVLSNFENKVMKNMAQKWKKSLTASQLNLIDKEIGILNSNLGYKK